MSSRTRVTGVQAHTHTHTHTHKAEQTIPEEKLRGVTMTLGLQPSLPHTEVPAADRLYVSHSSLVPTDNFKGYTEWVTTNHYFQHMLDMMVGGKNPQNRVASCPLLPHAKRHHVTYTGLWKWQASTGQFTDPIVRHTLLAQPEILSLSYLTLWHIWSTDELHC